VLEVVYMFQRDKVPFYLFLIVLFHNLHPNEKREVFFDEKIN
jgi:hypothetical protein